MMEGKFRRHLAALLRKNVLLKRRHPCTLLCELLLALGATGLLVLTRHLVSQTKATRNLPAQLNIQSMMPVRLPDCAEYIVECAAKLLEDKAHSAMCVKSLTYGCQVGHHGKPPSVWVIGGCNGSFSLGPDTEPVFCSSGLDRKPDSCVAAWKRSSHHRGRRLAQSLRAKKAFPLSRPRFQNPGMVLGRHSPISNRSARTWGHSPLQGAMHGNQNMEMFSSLLTADSTSGMRRLSGLFGIVAPGTGGHEFREWLQNQGHPWAGHVRLFASAEDLQAHVAASSYPQHDLDKNRSTALCGAVIFHTAPEASRVKYSLRFNSTLGFDPSLPPLQAVLHSTRIMTDELVDTPSEKGKAPGSFDPSGIRWYTQSGFLAMQRTVDAFLEEVATRHHPWHPHHSKEHRQTDHPVSMAAGLIGQDGTPHVVVPFPIAGREQDIFAMLMPGLLAPFLLISLAFSVNRMITSVVHEREARLKDGMRMMGMHQASFYTSWILTYIGIYLFVCTGVTLCLSVGGILPNSSASLLWVWLMLFSLASISYALFITAFFSKAKTAATIGSIAFFSSGYLQHLARPTSSPAFVRLLSLLPPVCFELTAKAIADLESQGVGICWQNASHAYWSFSVASGCRMLALDAVLLLVLFLYLDQVLPREIGLRRRWYFPLLPSFWSELCSSASQGSSRVAIADGEENEQELEEVRESSALVERDVGEAAAMMARNGQTVELRGLTKIYGEVRAVQALDLVMYAGEIFALLGHNGAGKTTTLGMLCGLMPPTRGSCTVFNHDRAHEPAQVQKLLGVCPQHDVLWPELTCKEHLTLFAGFKGVPRASTAEEVTAMLQRVGLPGAVHVQTARLSGGMKRKLSLGIAFLGGSRLVVLDEPTSGLDPYSRRMVWELLRTMKQNRVTVLSTHYMDEADILGDRIAILHEGRLRCCGTPTFLKRAYDCGYNVTLVKKTGCQTEAVREALICHIPELASEVVTLSDSGNELILQFPFAAAQHFPLVLGGLEQQLGELNVESYGVSVTTLEEVFLKVASGENVERPAVATGEHGKGAEGDYVELLEARGRAGEGTSGRDENNADSGATETTGLAASQREVSQATEARCSDSRRFCVHMRALLLKRWRYGLRDRRALLCQLFLPTATLVMLLAIISRALFHSMPSLELSASKYNEHCEDSPQNLVDFTHFASVDAKEAWTLLEPGKPFWQGELRRQAPQPEEKRDHLIEESLTSTLPGLTNLVRNSVSRAMKQAPEKFREDLNKVLEEAGNFRTRRLSETTAAEREEEAEVALSKELERCLWNLGTELWVQGQHFAEAPLAQAASAPLEAFGASAGAEAVRSLVRRSHAVEETASLSKRRLQADEEAGSAEERARMATQRAAAKWLPKLKKRLPHELEEELPWLQKDLEKLKHNVSAAFGDFASMQDLRTLFTPRVKASESTVDVCSELSFQERILWARVDHTHTGHISKEDFLRHLAKLAPNRDMRKNKMIEDALFMLVDQDHDGYISQRDYCMFVASIHREVVHLKELVEHFSNQLLETSASCPRYGAYFVLRGPRPSPSSWRPSADAAVFVNTSSAHSSAAFQAALSNARFARLGLRKEVEVHTHPFPQTPHEQQNLEKLAVFFLAIYITFSLSFIPAGIAHFVVKERETGARQLQVLSGASQISYHLSNLIYDVFLYVVPAVSIPLTLHQFGFKMIIMGDCGYALMAVLAAFGPAIAGFTYLVSFLFKDHSKASNVILILCLVGAGVLSTVLFVLAIINYNPMNKYPSACDYPTKEYPEGNCHSPEARRFDRILGPLFRLVPTVCVYQAMFSIALVANLKMAIPEEALDALKSAMGEQAPRVSFDPFSWEWAGEPLVYLMVEGVVFMLLVIMIDYCMHSPRVVRLLDAASCMRRISDWRAARRGQARSSPLIDGEGAGDESVETERERVAFVPPQDVALHVSRLEKSYRRWLALHTAPKNAVRGISFAVHTGEVFGLLGHNGAGKTTALKCFVGELGSTAGTVHVGGFDLMMQVGKARRRIGYCPQFDALLELLTVQDHLEFYAALKGLPTKEATARALCDFSLTKMARRRADVLSGGNKRKVSAAIALMGQPSLAILDEPTCGLDPAARRALWGAVHCAVNGAVWQTRSSKASAVLLTTHSMEEAEALSTRLGILAEGQLLTVGTAQQIKQRHGSCHELCLTLEAENETTLTSTLHHLGNGALRPETPLDFRSVGPLLERDECKRRAYSRPRCVVRGQIESLGFVEASVLAEWWLQQARGEEVEKFLRGLLGDGVELAENFGAYWRFRLPHCASVSLPKMFGHLEENGKRLAIAEYTLTQATLEQIFNSMAQVVDQDQQAAAAAAL